MPRRLAPPAGALGAREIAHEVLTRVETTAAFADVLLAKRLAGGGLNAADQALATRLVYGALAWQGRLDHHLAALVRTPLERLDPAVRAALRLGLYQLLCLDRVPAYAAVDASVGLVRALGRGATGLVNAVLRRAAALGPTGLALPDPAMDPVERLAVEWSHPRWLVERWAEEVGAEELPALLAADNAEAQVTLRANTLSTTRAALLAELAAAGVAASPGRWARDAVVVERGAARLRRLAAWTEGRFAFQGEASQLVTSLLDLRPGQKVLDACAAPGGKTAHLAALLGGSGSVLALDRRVAGVRRILAEAARLSAHRVRGVVADARRPPVQGMLDAALVDAPCSGLGTLRRHPELRWRRRPEDIPRLAALARELVSAVAPLVRPGGVLVYAVCTPTREEGPEVVSALCRAEPRFAVERPADLPAALLTPQGFLATLPHRHGLDGFFAARLRARG
jgi:16S rRNA (cytosine967-C5)-methyltransferase